MSLDAAAVQPGVAVRFFEKAEFVVKKSGPKSELAYSNKHTEYWVKRVLETTERRLPKKAVFSLGIRLR